MACREEIFKMKIKGIDTQFIEFDNGMILESEHDQDCCESHYADFESLIGQGWEDKEFPEHLSELVVDSEMEIKYTDDYNESWKSFFQIKDKDNNKYTLTIYNANNGYYSDNVTLVLKNGNIEEKIRIQ